MATFHNPNYRSYLLRIWRTNADTSWRATLINPLDGARQSFATLEGLYMYLNAVENDQSRACHHVEAPGKQPSLQNTEEDISL